MNFESKYLKQRHRDKLHYCIKQHFRVSDILKRWLLNIYSAPFTMDNYHCEFVNK